MNEKKLENGKCYIVAIDYSEPDFSPNTPGFTSQPRFYHTTDMEEARKRLKAEYEKAVAYAKEIGFTESDESELQTWVSQDDGSYEIYAGDSFSETGKIYEAERT